MSVSRPYWDGAGGGASRLLLKPFGTAAHSGNAQSLTISLSAANVKAGGIVFLVAREIDNGNAFPDPSGGWTRIGAFTANSRTIAAFYKLTPTDTAVSATFAADKKLSIWSMYLEDEKGRAHDIESYAAVAYTGGVYTNVNQTSLAVSLTNPPGDGYSLAFADYSDDNDAITIGITTPAGLAISDAFANYANGGWRIEGKYHGEPDTLPDTGAHTWTYSSLLSGRQIYLGAWSFQLTARLGSVPIDPPSPAVEKAGLSLAGTFEQITNVSGAVSKVTFVGNTQADRHVVVVVYGNGQSSDPPYPTLTCLNTGEQFTGLTKVWLSGPAVACWVMVLKNANLDFMNLQLTPPAGTPPWRFLCRVFALYGWDEVAHALTPATTTRDDDIWIDTGPVTEPGTALIAAVVGTSGTFFTIDNTEIVQNSILQGEGRLVVGVRNTPDPYPGGNVRAQMQCGSSNQMMCGMRFDCSDYTPPPVGEITLTHISTYNVGVGYGDQVWFDDCDIGPASDDRIVIVHITKQYSASNYPVVQLNGATMHLESDGVNRFVAWLLVPTGTIARIGYGGVVSNEIELNIYTLTGGLKSVVARSSKETGYSNSGLSLDPLTVPAGGVLIVFGDNGVNPVSFPSVWMGATQVGTDHYPGAYTRRLSVAMNTDAGEHAVFWDGGAGGMAIVGLVFSTAPQPWTPARLFDNGEDGFWIDGTDKNYMSLSRDGTGTVTAGGLVGQARTSAGRTIVFRSLGDDASRPVYNAATGLAFEGGQMLRADTVSALAYQFLLVVVRSRDAANSRRILSVGGDYDYENANQLAFHQDAGKIDWWRNGTRATYPRPTELVAVEVRPEGTTAPRNVDLYVNNVAGARVAQEELRDLYGPRIALGCSVDFNGSNCWIGDIAELIILDRALTTEERTELTAYIRAKYATPPEVWTPAKLFENGETGFWLDPMDTSKMGQNTDGTGAVAVGDRVGSWRTSAGSDVLFTAPGNDDTRPILRDKALEFSRAEGRMIRGVFAAGWQHGYVGVIWQATTVESNDPRFLSCGRPGEPDYNVDHRFTFNTKTVEAENPDSFKQEFLSNYRVAISWWPQTLFGQWQFGEVRHVGGQDVEVYRNYLWAGNTILPTSSPAEWTSITLGARNPGEEMLTGIVGEVIMRKEALTPDEMTALQLYIDERYGPLQVPSGTELFPTFKDSDDEP